MKNSRKYNGYSIVIPILNEERNLVKLLKKIKKSLKKFKFEIIFIDDNSSDKTHHLLKKIKKKYNFINYHIRKKNPDLSLSCILGFNKSKYSNIIVMDGDLQHDPKYLPKMANIFQNRKLDFLVGARNFDKFNIPGLSIIRFIASKILIYIFYLLVGKKTKDPMSGFFIFNKKFYLYNKKRLFGKGYKILPDLIYSNKKEIKVEDFNIVFNLRNKGKSKMNIKVLINIMFFIFFNFYRKLF